MAKAIWQGVTLAESDDCETVEGNLYFPPDAIERSYFEASEHTSVCPWKGTAHYYDIVVAGERNANAGWYYPETKPKADNIRNYVAFWNGVEVEK